MCGKAPPAPGALIKSAASRPELSHERDPVRGLYGANDIVGRPGFFTPTDARLL